MGLALKFINLKKVNLIVPVYNEQETIDFFLETTLRFFRENVNQNKFQLLISFVNDGSSDGTFEVLMKSYTQYDFIDIVDFSRNFGKENALFAGLSQLKGDIFIPIDVDLQDPLEIIPKMLEKYEEGFDVVLAKRVNRDSDSFFKRASSGFFYKFYNLLVDVKVESNVGDFRLMARHVVEEIIKLPENQLFMKGIFSWVGFKTTIIEYTREERSAGESKFNFFKLLKLATDGITSFSTLPLRLFVYIGFTIATFSFLFGIKIIIEKLFFGISELGYPSLITAVTFIGGIQIIGIGILGEYIGRIFLEAKRRPKYIIKNIYSK